MGFKELKNLLREQDSVDWREVDDGVVCDYRDGGDYALLRQAPENPWAWLARFQRTDDRRERFIAGLRWWAAEHRTSLFLFDKPKIPRRLAAWMLGVDERERGQKGVSP